MVEQFFTEVIRQASESAHTHAGQILRSAVADCAQLGKAGKAEEKKRMSNYAPHYAKKKERLSSHEGELTRAIREGKPRDALLRLAEEVRLARIRVLRAERAKLVPASKWHASNLAAFNAQVERLVATTSVDVLNEYL